MSYLAMFCVSRKGGTGGGGWVHLKGANSMAMSGFGHEKPLVGARECNYTCFKRKWT